jgi:hypothetical protein
MERSRVLFGAMSDTGVTGFVRAKRLQTNVGRILKKGTQRKRRSFCVCVSNTGARLRRRFGNAASSAHKGTGENRPGATGRSQRPAAVGRAGPFRPEEHTFFPSHSARRASFHYGKNDTVLSGIGTDRPARRRPAAAAARCAGRARGGRPVTGRGARMTGIRRQEAQSGQAAALLAGSLERQAACRAHARACGRARRDRDRRARAAPLGGGGSRSSTKCI